MPARDFRQLAREIRRSQWSYFFIAPALLLWSFFFIYPVLRAVYMSFTEWHPTGSEWVGLANYSANLKDPIFRIAMQNTFIFAVAVVVATTVIALFLSVLIFPLPNHAQAFFKGALYLPTVMSTAVVSMLWLWLFNPPYGLLNYLLGRIGVGPIAWLGDMRTALPAVMVMSVWRDLGTAVILLTAGMASIPSDLYDAAHVDGADGWQRLRWITVPLLRPVFLFLTVKNTLEAFQVFTPVWMLTRGGPVNHTLTVAYHIYLTAFQRLRLGSAAAQSVILFLAILVFSVLQFRLSSAEAEY